MQFVSMREFRVRGAKALAGGKKEDTVLLSSRGGPAYFLVPVRGDVAAQERELRRALAKASLRESWRRAEADSAFRLSDAQIETEIAGVRKKYRFPHAAPRRR